MLGTRTYFFRNTPAWQPRGPSTSFPGNLKDVSTDGKDIKPLNIFASVNKVVKGRREDLQPPLVCSSIPWLSALLPVALPYFLFGCQPVLGFAAGA
jgi:hypothetical protein